MATKLLNVSWLQASRSMHGSTYTKSLASLKTFTPEQMAEMQEAASCLANSQSLPLYFVTPTVGADHMYIVMACHVRSLSRPSTLNRWWKYRKQHHTLATVKVYPLLLLLLLLMLMT